MDESSMALYDYYYVDRLPEGKLCIVPGIGIMLRDPTGTGNVFTLPPLTSHGRQRVHEKGELMPCYSGVVEVDVEWLYKLLSKPTEGGLLSMIPNSDTNEGGGNEHH